MKHGDFFHRFLSTTGYRFVASSINLWENRWEHIREQIMTFLFDMGDILLGFPTGVLRGVVPSHPSHPFVGVEQKSWL